MTARLTWCEIWVAGQGGDECRVVLAAEKVSEEELSFSRRESEHAKAEVDVADRRSGGAQGTRFSRVDHSRTRRQHHWLRFPSNLHSRCDQLRRVKGESSNSKRR